MSAPKPTKDGTMQQLIQKLRRTLAVPTDNVSVRIAVCMVGGTAGWLLAQL
jgi:hypothetical protein